MFYFRQEIDTIDTISPDCTAIGSNGFEKPASMQEFSVRAGAPKRGALLRLVEWFTHRAAMRRSRLALYELTDEQLRDVGLKRDEALREARKVRFHLR